MMLDIKLKEGQFLIIEDHIKSKGILYEPLFYELVDHLSRLVDSKMKTGLTFGDAFERSKEEFGKDGFEKIYLQTIATLSPITLFRNNLKSAVRNIFKQRAYTVINLLGLIIGIAVSTTIGIYLHDELSFDRFHPQNVYRVSAQIIANGQEYDEAVSQFPLSEALKNEIPGIRSSFHMYKPYSIPLLKRKESKHVEDELYFIGETFFEVFGYQLIEGDKNSALKDPNSIILTREAANRYFGEDDPMGQTIQIDFGVTIKSLRVTGIINPENNRSHFKFEVLIPINFIFNYWEERFGPDGPEKEWLWTGAWTYIRLENDVDESTISEKLPSIVQKYFPEKWREQSILNLDRIEDIHLHSNKLAELEPNGSIVQVRVFGTIGLIVLLIAIINFINLMNAQGFGYAKQVGIRKFLGALRIDILQLYLLESIILCLVAGILALGVVQLVLLPQVNDISGKELSLIAHLIPQNIFIFVFGLVLLGTVAGIFPSLSLSRLEALHILKGKIQFGNQRAFMRQFFVAAQFIASVVLIIAVLVINAQNNLIRTINTGFDKENILIIEGSEAINERSESFKNEVLKLGGVTAISGVLDIPGRGTSSIRFVPEGRPEDQPEQLPITYSDYDLIDVLGIEMVSGRFFDRSQSTDVERAFILNEEAVNVFGWSNEEAVGKNFKMFAPGSPEIGKVGKVIGVVRNYNFESIHNPIRPLVIIMHQSLDYYLLKFDGSDLHDLQNRVTEVWSKFDPSRPMESYLLDQNLEELYAREQKLSWATNYGMGFAMAIALIGIYGLSSYLIYRRTKEIGLRKILGSNQINLIIILSRNFLGLIAFANVLAWPVAYYLMKSWLDNFIYRVPLSWYIFFSATAVSLVLAILAIGYHVIKISKTNPITSLRYE